MGRDRRFLDEREAGDDVNGDTATRPRPRPLCTGYLRRLPGVDEQVEQQLITAISDFADREGLTLTLVFIEKQPGHVAALHAVTHYCQNHAIRNVVVPTGEHLNRLPALAYLAQELLQQDVGGRVWIAAPSEEDHAP